MSFPDLFSLGVKIVTEWSGEKSEAKNHIKNFNNYNNQHADGYLFHLFTYLYFSILGRKVSPVSEQQEL